MKKLVFVMPLMAVSFLANCGCGNSNGTFTVIWMNWNGEVLETDHNVSRGTIPSYENDKPSREADKAYTYEFKGWDKDITVGIEEDTVFIAQYNSIPISYTATFINGDGKTPISFDADHLTITAPTFTPAEYRTGQWVSTESTKSADSGETINFTKEDLHNWTFNYQETDILYEVTFNYKDGVTPSVTKYISLSELELKAPKTTATPSIGQRYVWKSNNSIIESEGSKIFDKNDLKEYVFEETEVKNIYTISYKLYGGTVSGTNPITYTISDDITLIEPTQYGFTFKGWYLEPNEVHPLGGNGWEAGEMIGNLTLHADWHVEGKTLNDYTWDEISQKSIYGEVSKYFDVGETKKVQLKHQDSVGDGADKITEGELYQTVRIIDFNKDIDSNGNNLGITFEFADLISDANGYSLATQWNDTSSRNTANHNYLNSSVRKALTNEGDGHILWAQKGDETWSTDDDYKKSVLDMLPDSLTKDGILKTACKYININDGNGWKEETIDDKLFLLSPAEMGRTGHEDEEHDTTPYSYYDGAEATKKIKRQVNGTAKYTDDNYIPSGKGQIFTGTVYSYAGYNTKDDGTGGGFSWLRSPNTSYNYKAWHVVYDGLIISEFVFNYAFAVAPAFCI